MDVDVVNYASSARFRLDRSLTFSQPDRLNEVSQSAGLLEHIAIYLSLINCNMRQHRGAFHFMPVTLK